MRRNLYEIHVVMTSPIRPRLGISARSKHEVREIAARERIECIHCPMESALSGCAWPSRRRTSAASIPWYLSLCSLTQGGLSTAVLLRTARISFLAWSGTRSRTIRAYRASSAPVSGAELRSYDKAAALNLSPTLLYGAISQPDRRPCLVLDKKAVSCD